jgi:hypothetical protein
MPSTPTPSIFVAAQSARPTAMPGELNRVALMLWKPCWVNSPIPLRHWPTLNYLREDFTAMTVEAGAAVAEAAPDAALVELVALVRRAEREGDAVLPELRVFYDRHPDLWHRIGDLGKRAELALADLAAAGDITLKEAILRRIEELKSELAPADAPLLERILAANVALGWLAVHEAELTAANAQGALPPRADYLDRRRDRAHRRLESAVKTMSLVKKLLQPTPSPLEIATRVSVDRQATAPMRIRQGRSNPAVTVAN